MAGMRSFRVYRAVVAAALLVCSLTCGVDAQQTWREVRSPHFRVLTDSSAKDGRKVANEFEQMRHVFVLRFNNEHIDSGAPLTIVAGRDENTLRQLEPALWKAQGSRIAGEFHRGWEKQFALVRLDTWGDNNEVVVYHEYTHSVMHANAHWLPIWLDEGIAEFYAYTRFNSDHIYVGAPSQRLREMRQGFVPVTTMLDVTQRSPYYRDESKSQLFYAEAWGMVHYMIFGKGMENGDKLTKFIRALQDGENQQDAFRKVFGDPKTFDSELSSYLDHFSLSAGVLPPDKGMDSKSFPERDLTPAEADYELGCFHIGAGDRANGRSLIEKALALDPKLAGAHEELGFLEFEQGRDEDAKKEWNEAVTLDPTRARSVFALTMTGTPFDRQTPEQMRATQGTLKHVVELAPDYAPAFVEVALVEWRLGSIQQAYKDARQAEVLEPWRAGYRILTGRILLQGKQPAKAAEYSRYVAGHWFGPDHNEAVDLWNAVPAANRGEGAALAMDVPAGTQVVRGTLLDVSCGKEPGPKLTISFAPDGPGVSKPVTFTSDGRIMIGFSDTLWWGEDHFTLCHHLSGHRAVVALKAQAGGAGELMDLEVRDDLPVGAPVAAATHAEASTAPPRP